MDSCGWLRGMSWVELLFPQSMVWKTLQIIKFCKLHWSPYTINFAKYWTQKWVSLSIFAEISPILIHHHMPTFRSLLKVYICLKRYVLFLVFRPFIIIICSRDGHICVAVEILSLVFSPRLHLVPRKMMKWKKMMETKILFCCTEIPWIPILLSNKTSLNVSSATQEDWCTFCNIKGMFGINLQNLDLGF